MGDEGPNADWVGTVITDVGREDEYELQWARLGNWRDVHTCNRHMTSFGSSAHGAETDSRVSQMAWMRTGELDPGASQWARVPTDEQRVI
eukprot:3510842-Heterocapsa_arctica.AAC.1